MKIYIKIKTNAKENRVRRIDEKNFVVSVKEPPVNGKANAALIRLVAGYFDVPQNSVNIVSGFTSRQKVLTVG